jgi:hypothetical protein
MLYSYTAIGIAVKRYACMYIDVSREVEPAPENDHFVLMYARWIK